MARALIVSVVLVAACKPGHPPATPDDSSSTKVVLKPAAGERASREASARAPRDAATPPAVTSCVDDGEPFTRAALEQRVAFLASPALDGRVPATPGDTAARTHIAARLRCLGLVPGGDHGSYEQPFEAAGRATANLVGYVTGTDATVGSDIIVVGAHHDHLGGGHLGANDNASGVTAVLAIAQAVARHGAHKRTIAFVLFGGEEDGLLGSQRYVAHPPAALPLDRVVQMINLDMVGSYSSKRAVYAFGAFPGLTATKLLGELDGGYPKTRISIGGHSVRGDQLGFCQRRIPYVFFWTPDARCYHAACDTADRLDYAHMTDIVALAGDLVARLADADADLADARKRRGCAAR